MSKLAANEVFDAALQHIIDNGDKMTVCSGDPTTFAAANATNRLAEQTGLDSGDYTISDGDTSGRKIEIAAQSIASADASGTAAVICILDTTNSILLLKFDMSATQEITSGNPVDTPAFDYELRDPS